jgi:hypothetical protein
VPARDLPAVTITPETRFERDLGVTGDDGLEDDRVPYRSRRYRGIVLTLLGLMKA